ncbi:MAG: MFS transporter [Acidimicrobiia bacterium]|nr:MFS transporter [Acidimicrobiia bacterium]
MNPVTELKQRGERLIPSGEIRHAVAWMWIAGVALGYAGAHATNTEPLVRGTFGITAGTMSAVFGVARVGSLAAIFITARSDSHSRRAAFLLAYGVGLFASTMTALASSVALYTLAQTVTRLSITAAAIIGTVIIVETVRGKGRTYAVSLFGAAVSFGAGIATAALPIADLTPEGWRWVFASSVIGLVAIPRLASEIHEPPTRSQDVTPKWYRSMQNRQDFWRMSLASYLFAIFSTVAVAFIIEHLIGTLDMTASRAAVIALLGGTVGGSGFFVGSALANRIGRKNTTYLALVTSIVGGVALYAATDPWSVGAYVALSAFGSFLLIPSFGVWRNEMFAADIRSRAVTWINNAGIIGSICGLLAASVLIDRYGLPATIATLSLAAVAATVTLLGVPEPRPTHVERTKALGESFGEPEAH